MRDFFQLVSPMKQLTVVDPFRHPTYPVLPVCTPDGVSDLQTTMVNRTVPCGRYAEPERVGGGGAAPWHSVFTSQAVNCWLQGCQGRDPPDPSTDLLDESICPISLDLSVHRPHPHGCKLSRPRHIRQVDDDDVHP